MIKFENKQMQQFYIKMLEKEIIYLDLLIAQERVKLYYAKNLNTLFGTYYIDSRFLNWPDF